MSTARGLIKAFGNNNEGQCGVSGEEGSLSLATPVNTTVDLDYQVLSASSSLRQSFFVSKDYQLLSCGENDGGELARSGKKNNFLHIDMLSKYRIREVAVGNEFVHACTVDGRVISWGRNDFGQLGDGDRDRKDKPRVNSNFSESILQISVGDSHCIALSKGGNVLTWGGNRKGQLGDGQLTSSCVPKISPALIHRPVIGICAGANHCMVFTATGNAYVWGDNSHGQLGLGDTNFRAYPTQLRSLRSAKVCGISAGLAHSAAISPNGLLFTWGSNSHGQLGIDQTDTKMSLVPLVVEKLRDKTCTQVVCGSAHTLALCSRSNGEPIVYGMGLNSSGQLGGGPSAVHSPTIVNLGEGFHPIAVSSGPLALHSFVYSLGVPFQRAQLPRIDLEILREDCLKLATAKSSSALQTLREHVVAAFSSVSVLNASFYRRDSLTGSHHDVVSSSYGQSCIANLEAVREAYNLLFNTNEESVIAALGRATLKLTEHLKDCPYDDAENLNAFLIVLENPLLLNPEAFHIGIERVITGILALPHSSRSTLFGWLRSYAPEYFSRVVNVMNLYLTYALGDKVAHLDPSPAVLVLNSLYECNHADSPIIPDTSFYNSALESINIISEYEFFIRNQSENTSNSVFNYCRYPFLLPISVKRTLLAHDLNKLKLTAVSFFATAVLTKHIESIPPFIGITRGPDGVLELGTSHFSLTLKRSSLVFDLIYQLKLIIESGNQRYFELPLRVNFLDELAIDQGGVSKEMFSLCISQFVECMRRCADGRFIWFCDCWGPFDKIDPLNCDNYEEQQRLNDELKLSDLSSFYLGVIVGLALYNGVLIDLPLPPSVYKVLKQDALRLSDLQEIDAALAKGYKDLLSYGGECGPIQETFGVTFSASKHPLFDSKEVVELIENGNDVYVNYTNRQQYVELSVKHALYGSCKTQIDAFVNGLKITGATQQSFQYCSSKEMEDLICGTNFISSEEISLLRLHTTYKGVFNDEHPVVNWFWDTISSLSSDQKQKFIEFVTGSSRLPVEGISKISLILQSTEQDASTIPSSHTCFNALELTHKYESAEQLRAKLLIALEHSQGFGFA